MGWDKTDTTAVVWDKVGSTTVWDRTGSVVEVASYGFLSREGGIC